MAQDTAIRAAAQRYIDRGWAVIALYGVRDDGSCMCHKGADCGGSSGKHPVGAGRLGDGWCPPIGSVDELRAGYNIGLLTGSSSGFFVLDVDPKNGGDARLAELVAQYGPLPVTLVVRTGSGGVHYYFQLPDDFTPTISRGRLPVGLDIRGEGGQVVAPPSVSGFGTYVDAEMEGRAPYPIAPAPAWLLELIRPLPPIERPMTEGAPAYASGPQGASGRGAAYAAEAVQRVTWELRMATPGDRNNTAFRVACRLIELAYADWSGLSMDDAWAWYASAGRELVGPDFPEGELRTCWRQAIKEVRERPAVLPPPPGGQLAAQTFADWGGMPPFSQPSSDGFTGAPGLVTGGAIPHQRTEADPWGSALPPSGPAGTSSAPASPSEAPRGLKSPADDLMARLLSVEGLDQQANPEYLVEGLLEIGSESWMIGPPGGFKSFVALDIACHVAAGKHWQGLRVRQGRVLYVVAEGARGMKLRMQAWRRLHGDPGDIVFLPEPVQVSNPIAWGALLEVSRRLQPVAIVLDTQARLTVGLEENSAKDMGVFIDGVRALKAVTGACVLVVHHTGRKGGDARGSSALDGAQDTEVRVTRNGPRSMHAVVGLDKQKEGSDTAEVKIRLEVVDLGEDERTNRKLTSLAVRGLDPFDHAAPGKPEPEWRANLTDNQGKILSVLREHSDNTGALRSDIDRWLKDDYNLRMPYSSGSTALVSLVEKGLLARIGKTRYVLVEFLED